MKTLTKTKKQKFVIIDGLKYRKNGNFLTLTGKVNTLDNFHNYSRKQN